MVSTFTKPGATIQPRASMSIAPGTAPIVPTSTIVSPEIATSAFLGGLPLPSSTVPSRTDDCRQHHVSSTVALLSRDATLFTLLNRGSEILFQTHIRDAKLVPPLPNWPMVPVMPPVSRRSCGSHSRRHWRPCRQQQRACQRRCSDAHRPQRVRPHRRLRSKCERRRATPAVRG